MVRAGTGHLLGIQALIKAHQPTTMGHGQSQPIGSGDLARAEYSLPANQTFL
jgi:hypothetical protein